MLKELIKQIEIIILLTMRQIQLCEVRVEQKSVMNTVNS